MQDVFFWWGASIVYEEDVLGKNGRAIEIEK